MSEPLGCGDNGCEFYRGKVGTNGGCRCLKHIRPPALRFEVTSKVRELQNRLQLAELKIRDLQEVIQFCALGICSDEIKKRFDEANERSVNDE